MLAHPCVVRCEHATTVVVVYTSCNNQYESVIDFRSPKWLWIGRNALVLLAIKSTSIATLRKYYKPTTTCHSLYCLPACTQWNEMSRVAVCLVERRGEMHGLETNRNVLRHHTTMHTRTTDYTYLTAPRVAPAIHHLDP
jgi:hypothetical protein